MLELLSNLNQNLFFNLYNLSRQNFYLDTFMVFGSEYLILIIITILIFLCVKNFSRGKNFIILVAISLLLGYLFIKLLSLIYYEQRPFLTLPINPMVFMPSDASFPSRHTAIVTIFILSLIFTGFKHKKAMMIPIAWVGVSRVYTGVHYPLDILGGVFVGVAATLIAQKIILPKFSQRKKRP